MHVTQEPLGRHAEGEREHAEGDVDRVGPDERQLGEVALVELDLDLGLLDVGAGPLTTLGKQWPGRTVEIVARMAGLVAAGAAEAQSDTLSVNVDFTKWTKGEVVIATKFGFGFDPNGKQAGLNSQPAHIKEVAPHSSGSISTPSISLPSTV